MKSKCELCGQFGDTTAHVKDTEGEFQVIVTCRACHDAVVKPQSAEKAKLPLADYVKTLLYFWSAAAFVSLFAVGWGISSTLICKWSCVIFAVIGTFIGSTWMAYEEIQWMKQPQWR